MNGIIIVLEIPEAGSARAWSAGEPRPDLAPEALEGLVARWRDGRVRDFFLFESRESIQTFLVHRPNMTEAKGALTETARGLGWL